MFNISLENQIERKVYRTLHLDGVEDILAGAVLFMLGAALQNKPVIIAVLFVTPAVYFVRRFITYPRIGFILPALRNRTVRFGLGLTAVCGFAAVLLEAVLVISAKYPQSAVGRLLPAISLQYTELACLVLMLLGLGLYSSMRRWYAYALLVLALGSAAQLVHWMPLDGAALAGVVLVVSGLGLLWHFTRTYPVLSAEAPDLENGVEVAQ